MNKLIEKMFANRGYDHSSLRAINDPTYGKLKNIDEMVVRLRDFHDSGAEITVYPDFDMDGISSGVLGFAGFSELGFSVNLFVPDPEKGYGIRADDIDEVRFRFPNTKAIVTCDTGIGASEAAKRCKLLGIDFLVTDHHMQTSEVDAAVVVDPAAIGEEYPHPGICGAFVLWQVLQRYADLYCNFFTQEQIRRLIVFAGIGTVSDTMPMLYENRYATKAAVTICRMVYGDGTPSSVSMIQGCVRYQLAFWGLYNLMKACENAGIIKDSNSIDEGFFGFYMAPMFNSVKRMGGHMEQAFGVFFANESPRCAQALYKLNVERRDQVQKDLAACKARPQPYAPYIWISDAREGLLGLIATKLMEETGMPILVLNDRGVGSRRGDRYHGSGRCPDWYDASEKLADKGDFGGHPGAFGFGVPDEASLKNIYSFLKQDVPASFAASDQKEAVPDFVISTDWKGDTGIDISLFYGFLDEIDMYRPFGRMFPEPSALLKFRNKDVVEWKQMGNARQHLKVSLPNGFDVLCWNQGHLISEKDKDVEHLVTGMLERSIFKGEVSVCFKGTFLA